MRQHATPPWDEVTFGPCDAPLPIPVVTTAAPMREDAFLYLTTGDCLSAVHVKDGTTRWRQQVKLTRDPSDHPGANEHPEVSYPPPTRMTFATPRVVNGVISVSMSNYGAYTCAFKASDGALRWRTPTDARVASAPFMDWAVPLVKDGIVYSGTYALKEQDGSVQWRTALDSDTEGTLSLHALSADTLYATSHRGIYAIAAQNGRVRWLYQPEGGSHLSGPPVLADGLLYAGTNAFAGYPPKGQVFALDGETGVEVWRYWMVGGYAGAVADHARLYVRAGDGTLYVWDRRTGLLRWRRQFAAPGRSPGRIAQNVLYLGADGVYAISSEDGVILWRQDLGSSPSVSFHQPVVLDGAVYVARFDTRGRGTLYALEAGSGAEYWRTSYPSALAIAQQ